MTERRRAPAFLKLFGERNTGTNAIHALLSNTAEVLWLPSTAAEIDAAEFERIQEHCRNGSREREAAIDDIFAAAGARSAWKHCATNFDDVSVFRDTMVLFTVRHPASWLVSLFANPYHALSPLPEALAEFLFFEWETVGRERMMGEIFHPLRLYNQKLRSYRELMTKLEAAKIRFRWVRLEDLIADQELVYRTVATGLNWRDAHFELMDRSTKDPAKRLRDYQFYYAEERWREPLTELQDEVNAQIDWGAARAFGYEPV